MNAARLKKQQTYTCFDKFEASYACQSILAGVLFVLKATFRNFWVKELLHDVLFEIYKLILLFHPPSLYCIQVYDHERSFATGTTTGKTGCFFIDHVSQRESLFGTPSALGKVYQWRCKWIDRFYLGGCIFRFHSS